VELHGFLRSNVCLSCHTLHPRDAFQQALGDLNPAWAAFLADLLLNDGLGQDGALRTDDPAARSRRGLRTNPDGDVDLPDAPYSTFRYPACPRCLSDPPVLPDGSRGVVRVDADGAWAEGSTAGVLKPAVVMFGEAIAAEVKNAAEAAIDDSDRVLVIGSSLATYSAFRLIRQAKERGLPIGILNLGGVRGEDGFFEDLSIQDEAKGGVRISLDAQEILPDVVKMLEGLESSEKGDSGGVLGGVG
jgi:NAD-dependent deacetylase sirtuin 4